MMRGWLQSRSYAVLIAVMSLVTGAGSPALAQEKLDNYRISPSDVLQMKVYQEPDLDSKVRVNADGRVALPLIGEIVVAGKTISEAISVINASYRNGYLAHPQVSIDVAEYARRQVTIIGQVQKPNVYELPEGQRLTLLEAIAMAGGYTRIANPAKITLKRKEGGREVVHKLDGKRIASGAEKTVDIKPGDLIQVAESFF